MKVFEWKDTAYVSDKNLKGVDKYLDKKVNTLSWNISFYSDFVILHTENGKKQYTVIKEFRGKESTDSLYMLYGEDDEILVVRAERENFGYVLYAFEFEDTKEARDCYNQCVKFNIENTYTNLKRKM